MTVIAVASAKARGVTSVAELLVLLRPTGRRCVLIDADPAGGDWLLRPGVAPEPGLVSLAMAGRRRLESREVFNHVQVAGNIEVVVGPAASHQASAALEMISARLVAHLRSLTHEPDGGWEARVDSVIDCGRLTSGSPALPLALQVDLVVLVSSATAAALVHLAPLVELLRSLGAMPAVLLHGGDARSARYGPDEVAAAVGTEVIGTMADDPGPAARLVDQPGRIDGLGRSRLVRSMTQVTSRAWELAEHAETAPVSHPASAPPAHEVYAPVGWRELRGG